MRPACGSNRSLNKEWVELTNTSRYAVNLDGWTLRDESVHKHPIDHYRLAGRATVRIHAGEGRDTRSDLCQGRRAYVWNNDPDTATLRNDHGCFVDDGAWGPQAVCPAHPLQGWERRPASCAGHGDRGPCS